MDSPSISINVCKLQETNDTKIEDTYKVVQQQLKQVQEEATALRSEVRNLAHESVLLDKEELCLDLENKKLEEEISLLRSQTEEAACSSELLKWKTYKLELVKEFEQKSNESIYKEIHKDNEALSIEFMDVGENQKYKSGTGLNPTEIKNKIEELKKEIEKKKENIQMTDPNLLTSTELLKKRNAALFLRYQRQLDEVKARHKQRLTELGCLKRILAEKNDILKDISG